MKHPIIKSIAALPFLAGIAIGVYQLTFTPLTNGIRADRLLVEKGERRLTLYSEGRVIKRYAIALGRQPVGAKQLEGDGKTPEGRFTIDWRNPHSAAYRSLHISYPRPHHIAFARERHRSPGGGVMIHGLANGSGVLGPLHRLRDWTDGCVAVTNAEMDDLWRAVPDGTPIDIVP